jgi:hypothetical protein
MLLNKKTSVAKVVTTEICTSLKKKLLMFLICFVEFKFVSKLENVLMNINHVIFI